MTGEKDSWPALDVHATLASLPAIFQTSGDSIPSHVPYLHVDAERKTTWQQRLAGGSEKKVGLAWQISPLGDVDQPQLLPVTEFGRFAQIPGVRFVCLQLGPGAKPLTALRDRLTIDELEFDLDDDASTLGNMAAVIANLDLVITPDNAMAHLAGALGVPRGSRYLTCRTGDGSWTETTVLGIPRFACFGNPNVETGGRLSTADVRTAGNGCVQQYGRRYGNGIMTDTKTVRVEVTPGELAASILETIQAIVLVLDTQGRIVRFNRFMEVLSGYTLREVRDKDWFNTFLPESDQDRMHEVFQRSLRGTPVDGEINSIVTKSGDRREIAWWDKRLLDANGNILGLVCTGHDVTDSKEAQRKLMQADRLAAIGEAMAGLAHESRNALQRSQVCLEMLADRVEHQPEALELIQNIQKAQDDLHRLYEEVRQFAAPIHLNTQSTDVGEVVRHAWEHWPRFTAVGRCAFRNIRPATSNAAKRIHLP